mgnify:CR=1 FL=1
MEIILAKSAGFCFGVKRAIECAYNNITGSGKIYTYGPLIHNKFVISDLEEKGVSVIDNFDDIADENATVIIRSHGVPKAIYSELDERKINYIDCTCPFVKKIHNIVNDAYNNGDEIIIVGNKEHPEIIGINGWAENSGIIINSPEEALNTNIEKNKNYTLVVQTTYQTDIFAEISKIFCKFANVKIHNTICSATDDRQKEAVEIAEKVDKMIVIGDSKSSNTRKLFEISKKYCKNTFLCETIYNLQLNILRKSDKIGVTAGASTPPVIIKEAINIMSENENFAEMLDKSLITLHTGDVVTGTVISVSNGEVSVNLGYKSDGIIPRNEFSENPDVDPADVVKAGDEIEVFVVRVNDGDGNVLVSKKRLEANKGYEEIEEAFNNKTTIKGKITEIVKGGLIALINNKRVFVPSSQISNRFVEDLTEFKNKEFDFNILEFDKAKRRIIAGRKELVQKEIAEKRKKVFESIHAGDKIEGTVSRIVDFGAFVDIGGVDGLIHISEMSWGRVKKVSDVLSEGDKVTVTVLDVNSEKGKISLSLKDVNNDPWKSAPEKYAIGNIVEGKVVRMVPFGAFVELEEGVDGLIHISQISYKHIAKPEDVLEIGQVVKAKVTDFDVENKKISLSIKEAEGKPEEATGETTEA